MTGVPNLSTEEAAVMCGVAGGAAGSQQAVAGGSAAKLSDNFHTNFAIA